MRTTGGSDRAGADRCAGAAALEWVGLVTVAALLLGSVSTAVVRSEQRLQDRTHALICRVLAPDQQQGCADDDPVPAQAPPDGTAPDGTAPDGTAPEVQAPAIQAPAIQAPAIQAPVRAQAVQARTPGVAAAWPTMGGTRAVTPDAGVVPMTECADPVAAPPVTTSDVEPDGGVTTTTTTTRSTVCRGPAGGVRDCTQRTDTVDFAGGVLGPQDFTYRWECGAPVTATPVPYPGDETCADPAGRDVGSERACVGADGEVSGCSGVSLGAGTVSGAAVWFCSTGPLPTDAFDECHDLGASSAMCTVGDVELRCFQPRAGAATSTNAYARCRLPAAGDPLLDPVVVEAVEAGADPDAVVDACDAVVSASPAATAAGELLGPVPQDDALLLAELEATMDVLDQYLLAATGYDPAVPAQREAYQAQLSGAHDALQGQPAGSPLATSEQALDEVWTGAAQPPARRLPIGGGEAGARCRSNAVWMFVATGGAIFSQGERLGMTAAQRLTFAGVWVVASSGAFWLREQYESRMREYNSVPGSRRPYATVARQALVQTFQVARAYLASFSLPAAAPADPMQPDDWEAIFPTGDVEMQALNPMRVNQAGEVWQAAVNAQGDPEAPVALFLP